LNGKLYPEQSAMVVASGAAARLTPAGYEGSPALLAQLRALLLYCPNVVSLRLSSLGRAVHVERIKTRVESAYDFSA